MRNQRALPKSKTLVQHKVKKTFAQTISPLTFQLLHPFHELAPAKLVNIVVGVDVRRCILEKLL